MDAGTVKPDLAGNKCFHRCADPIPLRVGSGRPLLQLIICLYYYTQKGDMMLLSYSRGKIQKVQFLQD